MILNAVLIFFCVIAPFIGQFFADNLLAFEGISVSIWIISFFLLLYAFVAIYNDIDQINERTVFFSPWIFPVYKFNPKKNIIEKRNLPAISMVAGFFIMIGWSILCSLWV